MTARAEGEVPDAFDRHAHAYDRLVGANPGYHAHLRLSARRLVAGIPAARSARPRLLDLGCGTGASTAALLAAAPHAEVVAVDGSAGMLSRARAKPWPPSVSFVHARAEDLAAAGVEGPFDGILAAYLLRNVGHRDVLLRRLLELLRPDAPLAVHEYSVADSAAASAMWTAVCRTIVIPAGRALTGDASLYRYLWRSVLTFDGVRAVEGRLRRAGFTHVRTAPVTGWQRGIVHTFVGRRPASPPPTSPPPSTRVRRHGGTRGPRTAGAPPAVAVAGGGIAGLGAAVALAERGVTVHLIERERYLGGRAGGWPITLADGTTTTMTRGFHAFFRQYHNLRALLRRVDPRLDRLVPIGDYPLQHAGGHRESFAGLPRTPPFNALAFAARTPAFGLRELAGIRVRAALPLLDVSVPATYHRLDHLDAETFLDRIGFPRSARDLAFSVFSRSFFAAPRELSAAELAVMFHLYFLGSDDGLLFDVPAEPFTRAFWDPLGDYLAGLGADVRLGAGVEAVEAGGSRGHVVHYGGGELEVDATVLALDVGGLRDVVAASPGLGSPGWRERIARLRTAPPFLVSRYWFDGAVAADRPAFLGTAGYGPLDNISLLDRFDLEAQQWASRGGRHGPRSVAELHAYAVPDAVTPAALRGELHRAYPETAGLHAIDERHERRADCPLFPPGGFRSRPGVRTPDPCLMLAGDHVRVDLPVALMERAATTGLIAANTLLTEAGLTGHPVRTVPNHGRFPFHR